MVILVLLVPFGDIYVILSTPVFSFDRLVKREVENKTRTKQIDGEKTNGSFLVQKLFFEKKIFYR
jgi:hypothetical protein